MKIKTRFFSICFLVILTTDGLFSQNKLTGTVFDELTNNPLPGANIFVNPEPNEAPTVSIDGDQDIMVPHDGNPNTITVDTQVCAYGDDADGDYFTYLWTTGSTEACIDLTLEAGDYTYGVTVTDSYGAQNSTGMSVHVEEETNQAPSVVMDDNQDIEVPHDGTPSTTTVETTLCADGTDPEGDDITYLWNSASLYFGNVQDNILSVYYTSAVELGGFQFGITGASITSALDNSSSSFSESLYSKIL